MPEINTEKMINHLSPKWKDRPCPYCGGNQWTIANRIFELREYNGGNLVIGSVPIVPVIPVTCSNCGNTILINSIIAGIDFPNEESKKEGENG